MPRPHFATLKAMLAPRLVKAALGAVAIVAGYDAFSSQFGLPKLGKLVGMSGGLLPWWGWLLILQAVFVYALFEYVRRLPSPPTESDAASGVDAEDYRKLKLAVAGIVERLQNIEPKQLAIIQDYQNMRGLEAKFEEARTYTFGEINALRGQQNEITERLIHEVSTLYGALAAISHREQLHRLGQILEASADELLAPTTTEARLDDDGWDAWLANEHVWRSVLSQWCEIAAQYIPEIREQVLTIPDEHYRQKGMAKVEQFPDAEAYTVYKAFCAVLKHWREDRQEVYGAVHKAAFEGRGGYPNALLPSFGEKR